MADYCTIAQIEGILPKGIKVDDSTSDPPTRADVIAMIGNVTKQIDDAATEGGDTTPLTGNKAGTAALRSMREVAYQVMVQRSVAMDPKHEPLWLKWHEEFEAYLELLSGVAAAASGAPPVAGPPRSGEVVDPWFTRDMKL